MALLKSKGTTVIVTGVAPLKDFEVDEAIAGISEYAYHALIQSINEYRKDYYDAATPYAVANNPLGMARELGAAEALGNLLTVLANKRKPTE